MKFGIYAICDNKTQFNDPFAAMSDQVAIRQFAQYARHVELIKDNPADFCLFKLADYDNISGVIDPVLTPENLCSAMSFVEKE